MTFISKLVRAIFSMRLREIEDFRHNGCQVQDKQLKNLLKGAEGCKYLQQYSVKSREDFYRKLPIVTYEELSPYIEQILKGEENVLWNTATRWFAKSSGTTNDKSKYIPITSESLNECHYRAAKDIMAIFCDNYPDSNALSGKSLTLGGSHRIARQDGAVLCGDLSAILIENTPQWFSYKRLPQKETALLADFEEKVSRICQETTHQKVTNFAGVPSWNLVLMNKILEYTGKNNIHEIWPEMSLFVHGGINFTPYREQYQKIFPDQRMCYMETYNASEGFFAMQDDPNDTSMLLMLDIGIYYEFIPLSTLYDHSTIIPLEGVKKGVNYAMVISTNGGLWRYIIGDTVEFTSLAPYKIKITGRTKQFINAFGEELIVDNAERALEIACRETQAKIREYTVAPIFMEGNQKGGHQWLIEFLQPPTDLAKFTTYLDKTLQDLNSDYDAKRHHNTTLNEPLVTIATQNTFYRWLNSKGKVGGQNKIPRLSNDRKIIESILAQNT